jgi:hypothetical protein
MGIVPEGRQPGGVAAPELFAANSARGHNGLHGC